MFRLREIQLFRGESLKGNVRTAQRIRQRGFAKQRTPKLLGMGANLPMLGIEKWWARVYIPGYSTVCTITTLWAFSTTPLPVTKTTWSPLTR